MAENTEVEYVEYTPPIDIGKLGMVMRAYSDMMRLLTGVEPSICQFEEFMIREGYAKKVVR